MHSYLNLLEDILDNGTRSPNRTGVDTLSVFGRQMRFDLSDDSFPLLTTKKMHLKSIIYELLWFLNGDTNTKFLKDNGVSIWDEWANEDGDLGPIYGKQWRDFAGVDQITWLMNRLKTNPECRRLIVSAWNPADLPKMALAPCHCLFQFNTTLLTLKERFKEFSTNPQKYGVPEEQIVADLVDCEIEKTMDVLNVPTRKLSCQLYQRSADAPLGIPFNIASYALLTKMVAQCSNMLAHEFIWTGGDTHIYVNQVEPIKIQLQRYPFHSPKMLLNPAKKDIFSFQYSDFTLKDYQCHPAIKMEIAV